MEFLTRQNRRVAGDSIREGSGDLSAKDKYVIVLGGGDTGSDCVGTFDPARCVLRHAT